MFAYIAENQKTQNHLTERKDENLFKGKIMKFIIKEVLNLQSDRSGYILTCNSLSSAKKQASKRQCFEKTVLKIYDKAENLLSYKEGKKWIDNKTF